VSSAVGVLASSEEPRRKILQIAAPGLPFMVGTWRFIENVLNVCVQKGRVQFLESCTHSFRLIGSDPEPEQVHFPGECSGIGERSVIVGFGIQFAIAQHEHAAGSTEAADVGEEIEMIQRDLESLHTTHREAQPLRGGRDPKECGSSHR